jgi:hypothetical protein
MPLLTVLQKLFSESPFFTPLAILKANLEFFGVPAHPEPSTRLFRAQRQGTLWKIID